MRRLLVARLAERPVAPDQRLAALSEREMHPETISRKWGALSTLIHTLRGERYKQKGKHKQKS